MNKKISVPFFLVVALSLLILTACGSTSEAQGLEDEQGETSSDEHMDDHDDEHMDDHDDDDDHMSASDMTHLHVDPPEEFDSLTNPTAGDEESTAAGKVIFETNCAVCHGLEGKGDGEGAQGLDPQPATLADREMMSTLTDGYLFWRVSKGGAFEPFNSAMPAWEQVLSEEERWQVINYVLALGDEEHHEDEHNEEDHHDDEAEHHDD